MSASSLPSKAILVQACHRRGHPDSRRLGRSRECAALVAQGCRSGACASCPEAGAEMHRACSTHRFWKPRPLEACPATSFLSRNRPLRRRAAQHGPRTGCVRHRPVPPRRPTRSAHARISTAGDGSRRAHSWLPAALPCSATAGHGRRHVSPAPPRRGALGLLWFAARRALLAAQPNNPAVARPAPGRSLLLFEARAGWHAFARWSARGEVVGWGTRQTPVPPGYTLPQPETATKKRLTASPAGRLPC